MTYHARSQDLAFRITVRRNKLFGLWAAWRLGLPAGIAAHSYAAEVVTADFEEPGDEDVIRKVSGDFARKGVMIGEAELRVQLAHAAGEARRQLSSP